MIYPIILKSTTTNIPANVATPNASGDALRNLTEKVLRIREMRFHINHTVGMGTTLSQSEFALMTFQLRLGNNPITSQYVPLAAMCEPIDMSQEAAATEGSFRFGPPAVRFRKPVLLSPGEAITYSVLHTIAVGNRDVDVTLVCEEATSNVGVTPWISFWNSPSHTDGSGDFEDLSGESDLVNPFARSMFVERLIGRVIFNDGSVSGSTIPGMTRSFLDLIRVRIDDHLGRQIVRDPTPMGVLFDYPRRAWRVNSMLDARGFYRIYQDMKLTTQLIGGGPGVFRTIIGMLGYHASRE